MRSVATRSRSRAFIATATSSFTRSVIFIHRPG
jgi:hypothetical protein